MLVMVVTSWQAVLIQLDSSYLLFSRIGPGKQLAGSSKLSRDEASTLAFF